VAGLRLGRGREPGVLPAVVREASVTEGQEGAGEGGIKSA
jgi:hypothetical protein